MGKKGKIGWISRLNLQRQLLAVTNRISMIEASLLDHTNIDRLDPLYRDFSTCARTDYRWDLDPVDFPTFKNAVLNQMLSGMLIEDTAQNKPLGFMLYRLEDHRAIEINVIYLEDGVEAKTPIDRLMRCFINTVRGSEGWDTVSYAMLGKQADLIRTMTWYGFAPLGQAILKFEIMNPINIQILKQQELPALPEGYRLDQWQPQYAGETAQSIFEAFSIAADAKWDPRFRSLLGCKRIVATLTSGAYGTLLEECTSILLKDDVPVGFCFLVQPEMTQANIPLVGVRPDEKGKGLGNHLMKRTLDSCIEGILAGKIGMNDITATMETDNFPAIKMYRRFGFKEDYNYPHVFLEHDRMKTWEPGKWC